MGFLSRIVADARAHAPVATARASAAGRAPAAAAPDGGGWEIEIVAEDAEHAPSSTDEALGSAPRSPVQPTSPTAGAELATPPRVAPSPGTPALATLSPRVRRDVPHEVAAPSPSHPLAPAATPAPPASAAAALPADGRTPALEATRRPATAAPGQSRGSATAAILRSDPAADRLAAALDPAPARADLPRAGGSGAGMEGADGGDHDHGVVPVHVHGHDHGLDHVNVHVNVNVSDRDRDRRDGLEDVDRAAEADHRAPSRRERIAPGAIEGAVAPMAAPATREAVGRAAEPRLRERPLASEPIAAPRVHIGRLEVIVVAPQAPPARSVPRGPTDLASRRYLRKA